MTANNSHKTALHRKAPSAPARWLQEEGKLAGEMLDYGCGHGYDADAYDMDKYDDVYHPKRPSKRYDVITATYVINTVFPKEVQPILNDIKSFLKPDGIAYISVRRDKVAEGFTSRGTYQWTVTLPLPIVFENYRFCIYSLTGGEE